MPTLTTFIQHSIGIQSHSNQTRKRNKGIKKEEVKLSLFADYIPYIVNPKDGTKNLLELIIEFNNAALCNINIQKSVAFLYTDISEREIKTTIPFTIASKRINCLGINRTKDVKGLYSENYKTVMNKTEDKTNRWKDVPCT